MLDVSAGKGPALPSAPGQAVPKWAPPFGVVEGPYARHYARWLIPDPVFDGLQPEHRSVAESTRTKTVAAEGRTTRNSMPDVGSVGKQRPVRGNTGHKLQALSSGYPQPKDKQAPCVLKRSDGLTVKLVCIDCHRWDFSSTQGFINHCRIAHRRDFKSHEEAAVHCGHPIEVDDHGAAVGEDPKPAASNPGSALVHPFARTEPVSDQQAYKALLSRISSSLDLYHAGKLPHVSCIPRAAASAPKSKASAGSSLTPYLSKLLQKRNMGGDLSEQVNDAQTRMDWDVLLSGDESDDADQPSARDGAPAPKTKPARPAARTPAVMRVPARSAVSPPPSAAARPPSSKGRTKTNLALVASAESHPSPELPKTPLFDDDLDVELSPNTNASNNAPSLVSDDGEYDDSDDGSSSEASEDLETESLSDVAEIDIGEDNDGQLDATRPIHRCRQPNNGKAVVNLKKDESRHVTFVAALPSPPAVTKGRRKQKARAS